MQRIIIVAAAVIFLVAGVLVGMSYRRWFPPAEDKPLAEAVETDGSAAAPKSPVAMDEPKPSAATADTENPPTGKQPPVEGMEGLIETQFQELEKLKKQVAQLRQENKTQAGLIENLKHETNLQAGSGSTSKPELKQVVFLGSDLFLPGKVSLSPKGYKSLKPLAERISTMGKIRITVSGHTDNARLGSPKMKRYGDNLGLSVARALEVARGLISLGVPQKSIGVCGYGDSRPAVPNTSPKNMARNRRVVISFSPVE